MKSQLRKFLRLVVALAAVSAGSAGAELQQLEEPYEVTQLRITMFTADTGQVLVSACPDCENITLEIVPTTQLFKANKNVPLAQAEKFFGQGGVVFRDIDSQQVTRIKIY